MRPVLQRRAVAAQKTMDRFQGKPFAFGRNDCGQMVKFHLRAIGRPAKVAARAGTYHSLIGAQKALKRIGFSNLIVAMDAHFQRIPPAAALTGDVMALPGQEGPGALFVAVGNGRVLGYHEEAEVAVVMQPVEYVAAWRILE